ncbi:WD repeat-containing protein 26 [Escovopsis weberi]|uniref:WD repeat-containing protein 26 n=1 Tax=Escovopsis weberi TaxID=150374 RepID=A0A0M8N3G9_ESCWE|nr:WD repeat-containing protein 26 [Escovopsis weberi]
MLADGDMMGGPSTMHAAARSNGAVAASPVATNGTRKAGFMTNGSSNGSSNGKARSPASAAQPSLYFGHNRQEVTRILIQALSDMGYQAAADSVSQESGYELESNTVSAFRSAVLAGSWEEAEQLLSGARTADVPAHDGGNGLVLAPGSDRNLMKFWLRQQKFLELLEQRDTIRALLTLRSELTPLYQDTAKLHFLSSLLMCCSTEELMIKADWDGAHGQSRRILLSDLSKCISPSVMLPENRLAVLLQHVKDSQINGCLYHTAPTSPSLYSDHTCHRRDFPSEVALELNELGGEIWQVQFSHDGSKLAACGSRDLVIIWDLATFSVTTTLPGHGKDGRESGVCNVAWSPDDSMIVTCSFDKYARLWDAKTGDLLKRSRRFDEPVSGCVWASDNKSFVIGSLDITHALCTFFVHDDEVIEWSKKHRVQDLCGSPDERLIVAVDDQSTIHVYDATSRQLKFCIDFSSRPTSVSVSQDSQHLLVNSQAGEAHLIELSSRDSVQKFTGHTGGSFLIRSAFGGANENFVLSGSEDGHILIWHKAMGLTLERLMAHRPRCNAVSWNPADPCMLASGGDDGRVKMLELRI